MRRRPRPTPRRAPSTSARSRSATSSTGASEMSLFGSLNVGMRGLHAAQVAIDVTGQNISNANTEGYSRKRVGMQADAVQDAVYGQIGLGVEVTEITRVRNEFLDRQTWEQMGDKGYYSEMDK